MNTAAAMLCPTCKVDLTMSERQGIEIDYCPKCRGVWLDRGELDKIIEKSAAHMAPQPAAAPRPTERFDDRRPDFRRRDDDDDDRRRYGGHSKDYKRKSWLTEIFD